MNTYSLFILKPGFTDKFKELNKVLVENKIKIEETEKEFIERTRKLVKEVLRPSLALSREKYKILSDEEFNQLTTTANVIHASDSPESAQEEILNLF